MTHPDRAEDYLEHIADAIQRATRYVGNLKNLEALEKDEQAQDAIVGRTRMESLRPYMTL